MYRNAGESEQRKSSLIMMSSCQADLYCEQTFEENSTLEGILGELIIPAVRRKEMILREKGLICLGLCCLIARVYYRQVSQSGLTFVAENGCQFASIVHEPSPSCAGDVEAACTPSGLRYAHGA